MSPDQRIRGRIWVKILGHWFRQKILRRPLCLLAFIIFIAFIRRPGLHARMMKQLLMKTRLNHLPIPPNKVSVVIMNHGRPRMIQESLLMKTLLAHTNIDDILLCHSKESTKFEYQHPQVNNIDAIYANKVLGLSLRFHYCSTAAKNEWVIIADDDQEMSLNAIDELLKEFGTNPFRIVGKFGREYSYPRHPRQHGYSSHLVIGPSEVILTKIMMLQREMCGEFFRYQSLVQDIVVESHPYWNGEDIFMSLVANHVYGVPLDGPYNNYAMDLDVWEAPATDEEYGASVSGNGVPGVTQDHFRYRGILWSHAKRRLAAERNNWGSFRTESD